MAYVCRDVAIILRQLKFKKSQSPQTFHYERKKVFELMFVLESKGKGKIKLRSFRPLATFITYTWRHWFLTFVCLFVCLFDLILYVHSTIFQLCRRVFLGWTSTKLGYMCLAQVPQCSDAGEARTHGPSVSSQALYHWATALPIFNVIGRLYPKYQE